MFQLNFCRHFSAKKLPYWYFELLCPVLHVYYIFLSLSASAPKILLTEPKNEQTTQKTATQHEQQQQQNDDAEQNGDSEPDQHLIEDDPEHAR